MILLIVLLLVGEGAAACRPTRVTGNAVGEPDDNSILESIRERDAKPSSPRSRREAAVLDSSTASSMSSSTEANERLAYETAINQTISDYYAQRKAVMDRYYARQRAIVEKFARKTPKPGKAAGVIVATSPLPITTTTTTTTSQTILERATTVRTLETTTTEKYREPESNGRVEDTRPSVNQRGTDREDDKGDKNPSTAWRYRSNNWNPRISDRDSDIDLEPESSNALETSVRQAADIPGYYKLGNFKGTKDEKVVYQHNLGVGLKGSSQLDATFEAVIDGPYEITIVEAFPYANTRANFTWLGGGPGDNFVKLKLKGYENEGFSYSVKVWGVPKDTR